MDPLSGAASVFAVVSLAAQVANGIQTLCDFWESVQDGPKEVSCILKDLQVVSNVLEDIREEMLSHNEMPFSRGVTSTDDALDSCASNIATLSALIDAFQPGFASNKGKFKKWAALKAAWKGEKIRKFRETLRETKTTLLLARQNSIARALNIRSNQQRQDLEVIAYGMRLLLTQNGPTMTMMPPRKTLECQEHINALKEECWAMSTHVESSTQTTKYLTDLGLSLTNSSISTGVNSKHQKRRPISISQRNPAFVTHNIKTETTSVITSILGKLRIYTSTSRSMAGSLVEDLQEEAHDMVCRDGFQAVVMIHPSWWLSTIGIIWGIKIALSKSIRGLDCRLRTYHAVPDDSLVFRVCQDGDVTALQELLSKRQASPWDTDSRGLTPLFYAARARQLQVCQILIDQGADVCARTFTDDSVASYACLKASGSVNTSCRDHIEILRLFLEHLDFSDNVNCSGLWGLRRLLMTARCNDRSCPHPQNHPASLLWALPLLQQEMSLDIPAIGRGISQLINQAMILDNVEALEQVVKVAGDINSRHTLIWFSPAHNLVTSRARSGIRKSERCNRFLISHGLDLHVVMDQSFKVNLLRKRRPDQTPLSVAMSCSESFFLFRALLQDMNISFEGFIEEELRFHPLAQAGWTRTTLLRLFQLEYRPLILPIMVCQSCGMHDVALETTWLSLLDKLKFTPETIYSACEVTMTRERENLLGNDIAETICSYCKITEINHSEASSGEDSMFLFSF